jgi:acyl-CoA oxidase
MVRDELKVLLDGDDAEIRDKVRGWLGTPGNEPASELPMEEHRRLVMEWAKDLTTEGDTAIGFPKEYGGQDDVGRYVAAFETLGLGDLSLLVKLGVHFGLFGGAILHLGTRKHHERYLRDVITLDLPGCFGMTETGHGSNVAHLETTATYDHDAGEFVIHTPNDSARKDYIGNAACDGRLCTVFAQLEVGGEQRGVHCLVVPLRDEDGNVAEGIRIEDCGAKLGLDGVDNGRIWFDQVRVPRDAMLDQHAQVREDGSYYSPIENKTKRFFTMLGTLVMGRVSVCGAAISAAKVAQVIAVRHALTRKQFGPPGEAEVVLMRYRTHQRRLLPDLAHTYALHFAQERLRARLDDIFRYDREEPAGDRERKELETLAAGLKAIATWHATDTIQACREATGGAGYLRTNRFASLKADTDVFTTFEGDNTVLLQLCAKNLLTDYRDQFGELDPLGTAAFVAGQVLETVAERTAVREVLSRLADELVPGRAEEGDLLDRDTQLRLVRWRADHILQGAARRLRGGIESGREPFEVLLECQDHVLECARAWVDVQVLEAFSGAVERCPEGPARELLDRLCSLHALHRIEGERGWYQEHGRLSSVRSKALIKSVNALCEEVAGDAEELVEGFAVPENALGDARSVPAGAEGAA